MKRIYKATVLSFFIAVFLGAVMLLPAAKPAQALPPRPVPTPTMIPTPVPSHGVQKGAYIEMDRQDDFHAPDLWSVVQWLDGEGHWHDVMGWRGYVDRGGSRWWVANDDFDTGPFRWLLYDNPEEHTLLSISENFQLPTYEDQVIMVNVWEEQ